MTALGLTAAAEAAAKAAADAGIYKTMFGLGHPLDLAQRTTTLITSNDGYQRDLALVFYNFFHKKSKVTSAYEDKSVTPTGTWINLENQIPLEIASQQSLDELHKSIIRKF